MKMLPISVVAIHPIVLSQISEHYQRRRSNSSSGDFCAYGFCCGVIYPDLSVHIQMVFEATTSLNGEIDEKDVPDNVQFHSTFHPPSALVGWYRVGRTQLPLTEKHHNVHKSLTRTHPTSVLLCVSNGNVRQLTSTVKPSIQVLKFEDGVFKPLPCRFYENESELIANCGLIKPVHGLKLKQRIDCVISFFDLLFQGFKFAAEYLRQVEQKEIEENDERITTIRRIYRDVTSLRNNINSNLHQMLIDKLVRLKMYERQVSDSQRREEKRPWLGCFGRLSKGGQSQKQLSEF
ncbi:hypothetical protein ACOME3_009887 [Neoechinorhynchus agilis]